MVAYRFGKKEKIIGHVGSLLLSVIVFMAILVAFLYALSSISASTLERQQEALEDAINRSVISCYCVEGTYPPSLDYLVEHYGLTYDSDLFFVDYKAIGANILPDITIIRKDNKHN
ncbi:MAG: hypothetical protein MJ107_01555 [Lachnospiraceae bacterium]|nr:hypothetical protein [Lachnospiraceae bacterium]